MKLKDILKNINYTILNGSIDKEINDIKYDSRTVSKNDIFVAINGYNKDGHEYIPEAINKGASVIIVSKIMNIPGSVTVIKVDNTRSTLAYISKNYFNNPGDKLIKIAVTGTSGKTTTTFMIREILKEAGINVGLIGSNGVFYGDEIIDTLNTTPESYNIHSYFKKMLDSKVTHVVMEASSQAFKLDRLLGITFDYGILTNITSDHIGPKEHENEEEYISCKNKLFLNSKKIIINNDSKHLEAVLKGVDTDKLTYGFKNSDIIVDKDKLINNEKNLGSIFTTKGLINDEFTLGIPGDYNIYNALAAILLAYELKIPVEIIKKALLKTVVKGRMELGLVTDEYKVLIDYAHTEDEMNNLINTIKEYKTNRLISIFGAGGNRDRKRRISAGRIIGAKSDLSIITMDNPRFEELSTINKDIKEGLNEVNAKYIEIDDREEAIKYAINNHEKGDLILLLGKGHEEYQEIKGVKYRFSERAILDEIKNTL